MIETFTFHSVVFSLFFHKDFLAWLLLNFYLILIAYLIIVIIFCKMLLVYVIYIRIDNLILIIFLFVWLYVYLFSLTIALICSTKKILSIILPKIYWYRLKTHIHRLLRSHRFVRQKVNCIRWSERCVCQKSRELIIYILWYIKFSWRTLFAKILTRQFFLFHLYLYFTN